MLKPLTSIENWLSIYDKGGLHAAMYILPIQPVYFAEPFQAFAGFLPPEYCCTTDLATLASKTDLIMPKC